AIPLPVPSGGAIFFHPLTINGSRVNHTDGIRWSFDVRYNVTGDPTGRPMFPDFVARSRAHPETVLQDARQWHAMWEDTRLRLAAEAPIQVHRWSPDAAHCA
ncbi:MAG: phytanoyl-CoA dioxygenase family protein, partial [Alphaproteobacteria bacterium]